MTHIKKQKKRGAAGSLQPLPFPPSVRQCASHAQRHDPDSHATCSASLCSACAASAISARIFSKSTPHEEHSDPYAKDSSAFSVIGESFISQSIRSHEELPHSQQSVSVMLLFSVQVCAQPMISAPCAVCFGAAIVCFLLRISLPHQSQETIPARRSGAGCHPRSVRFG